MPNLSQIIDKIKIINNMEYNINNNCKQLLKEYIKIAKKLQEENQPEFVVTDITDSRFTIKIDKYNIFFAIMNQYAVPKENIELLKNDFFTLHDIATKPKYQQTYCGCISIYYEQPDFDKNIVEYLGRIFVNKNFEVAVQKTNEYIEFKSKDKTISNIEKTIILFMDTLFNVIPYFKDTKKVYRLDREIFNKGESQQIGFTSN